MTNIYEQHFKKTESRLNLCCGQLGSYEALLNYAIEGLRGDTACKGEDLANFLEQRHKQLLEEQNEKIFERKIVAA
jgi:hypothetical protein